jgi:GT2 family glycosyltransferase
MPTLSIIIITYNSAEHIGACLDALQRQSATHEVIIVDNASQDNTVALVQAHPLTVRLLPQEENRGFAGGVNCGASVAQGEIIALLNPDALPEADWLEQLVAPFADPQIGVVGSKVLHEDGRIQSVGSLLQTPVLLTAHRGDGEHDAGQYDELTDVWAVHGAAMAFRISLWQELDGFDEGFFPAYWEESDFCERARRAGRRVVVAPQAVVRHAEATTTGKYSAQFYFYYHRNRLRYAAKWLPWPSLWNEFRPAERARLATAPLLDRRVARLVYEAGVPSLTAMRADERAAVLATGRELRNGTLPADSFAILERQLRELEANSVLEEVTFQSRLPLVARLRTAWNNVATRWYVRPNFDQQTRFNLAAQRALAAFAEQQAARAAADALDVALLAWRLKELESRYVSAR